MVAEHLKDPKDIEQNVLGSNQPLHILSQVTRLFNDQQIRSIWDTEQEKQWFSVVDIVSALTESDHTSARNYWKWLKGKLTEEGNQLVSATNQLKMKAADGKKYLTDVVDIEQALRLIQSIPSKKAEPFKSWLAKVGTERISAMSPPLGGTNSLTSLHLTEVDRISLNRIRQLSIDDALSRFEVGTTKGLQQIHQYLFEGLYPFAGEVRTKTISKGGFKFTKAEMLQSQLDEIERMPEGLFEQIIEKYIAMNTAHPFMEGNGRSGRIWLDMMLRKNLERCIDWKAITKTDYTEAMKESPMYDMGLKELLFAALTDKIDDCGIFLRGIEQSYLYESESYVD